MNKILRISSNLLALFAFILVLATILLHLFSWSPYIVLSGSMEPSISTGSLCLVDEKVAYEKIEVGDVIAFRLGDTDTLVTHRVKAITKAGLETKGDANEVSDGISTTKENYVGKTVMSIPYGGYVIAFFQQTKAKIFLAAGVIFLFVFEMIDAKPNRKVSKEEERYYY